MTQPELVTEDDVVLYTRGKRRDLVEALTKTGAPTDKDSQQVLLSALDGLDRSALGRLKIKAEEKANVNNANSAAIIAKVLSEIGSTKIYQTDILINREAPTLGLDIPEPDIVDGELETNPQQTNYETFIKQFED